MTDRTHDAENTHCLNTVPGSTRGLIRRCGEPVSRVGALYCEVCSGPAADTSGPREAEASNPASTPIQSPGGRPIPIIHGPAKPDTSALLDCLIDGFRNSVWLLARRDYRMSADLLEEAAAKLQEESDGERRRAKAEARGRQR